MAGHFANGGGTDRVVPPSGHVAGVWGTVDGARGVHRAPANEPLQGVVGLERVLTDAEQGPLNVAGVNCLRAFPARGIRVWGARTLSHDVDWQYINVRRFASYVEGSIRQLTAASVFEPNDERLWSSIRDSVAAFLTTQWREGRLLGAAPDEAFYVRCDDSNNPPESLAARELVCDLGVAAVRPAEFIALHVVQEMTE